MTTWYVCAEGDHPQTNKYIVQVIGEQNMEYLCKGKKCADGGIRNLFRCPQGYFDVRRTIAAISEHGLKVEVFKEEIPDVIVRFDLWKPKFLKRKMHANLKRGVGSQSRRLRDKLKRTRPVS